MSERLTPGRAVASLAREFVLWALVIGPFLYLYSGHPAGGSQAVLPHLGVVSLVWLALSCLRLAVWRWMPNRHAARALAALLLGAVLIVLVAYYLLVLAGLWSWGRVASWALVSNYIDQVPDIARSLGLSMSLVVVVAVLSIGIALALVDWLFTRNDWTQWAAGRWSRTIVAAVVLGGLCTVAVESLALVTVPPLARREPISLTFSADGDQHRHQSSQNPASPELVAAARADRLGYRPAATPKRPNVVLVVVDALRADRMSLYGYERDTTPYLMSLQRKGQVSIVRRAVAACPESFCGLLAIARSKPLHRLTDQDLSLHEVLRHHGYRIELMLAGDHTNFYGLRKAYGAVDRYFDGSMVPGRNVNDDELVLERVNALPAWDGQPVLLQFHLMSAHLLGQRDPKFARFLPAKPYVPWRKDAASDLTKPQVETGNHYDNGVLQMDDVLRRLVGALAERQYLRDAILVLTGDHGEMLGEHGEYGHAKSVFEAAMRVPIVFAGFGLPPPALDPTLPESWASQLDIAPTLLNLMSMPAPQTWVGTPLQRKLPQRRLAFQQGHFIGVYDNTQPGNTLKYWRHLHTGDERVYDIDADPAESRNLLLKLDAKRLEALRAASQPVAASVPD